MNHAPPWTPADPMVSVVTITYQHAPFIERNVGGVLEQRTSFQVEQLIGEDESTDGTREICLRLAAAHPERIRLFLRSRKDVMHIMGRPTGRANVLGLYREARGKYIAVCPGDDHWIDPEKLQLQVDLLERRPELSGCFTNAWEQKGDHREDYLRPWLRGTVPAKDTALDDLVERNFIPAATLVFRREILFPLPPAFLTAPISDWILVLHLAAQGPIGYIDRHTAVREVHPGGIISMKGQVHKLEMNIAMLHEIMTLVPERLRLHARKRLLELHLEALQWCVDQGLPAEASMFWRKLRALPWYDEPLRRRVRWEILANWPRLARWIHRLRS